MQNDGLFFWEFPIAAKHAALGKAKHCSREQTNVLAARSRMKMNVLHDKLPVASANPNISCSRCLTRLCEGTFGTDGSRRKPTETYALMTCVRTHWNQTFHFFLNCSSGWMDFKNAALAWFASMLKLIFFGNTDVTTLNSSSTQRETWAADDRQQQAHGATDLLLLLMTSLLSLH